MQIEFLKKWIGILVFKVSSVEIGYDITRLHILSHIKYTLISEGLLEYEGMKIPIFPLGDFFNIKNNPKNKDKSILIFESKTGNIGFVIDEIEEILPLDNISLEKEFRFEKEASNNYIFGKLLFEGRIILILDFDKIAAYVMETKKEIIKSSVIAEY